MRVATGMLAFVIAWPLVQHGLARSLELDPWSFFGFAMYAVPNLKLTVRAAVPGAAGEPLDWNAVPVSSYGLLREYAERRARFGKLLPPDALAAELLERHPEIPGVVVRIRRWQISGESSRLEAVDSDFAYRREGDRS